MRSVLGLMQTGSAEFSVKEEVCLVQVALSFSSRRSEDRGSTLCIGRLLEQSQPELLKIQIELSID